jgi:PAS domain-containing protein
MVPSEDEPQTILDTIPALAWAARPDGSAEFFNRRWLDYTGLSAEQTRDWTWTTAIVPKRFPFRHADKSTADWSGFCST